MKFSRPLSAAVTAVLLTSCSHLSREAKEIVGTYFNPELSQTDPVMELHGDATCVVRAIKPGVLTYSVEGTWNVVNDSIVFHIDPSTLKSEGDRMLIGEIPATYSRRVVEYNEFNLQLEKDGVVYLYQRRAE